MSSSDNFCQTSELLTVTILNATFMCTVCVQWDDMQIGLGAGTTLPLVEHCIGVHHGDCDDLYFETIETVK